MRTRSEPFRFASCLTMLVVDWALYTATMTMHGSWSRAWMISTAVGSALTFVTVAALESRAVEARPRALGGPRHTFLRGLAAAAVVAMPLPVLGTAVALGVAIWGAAQRRAPVRAD